MVADVVGGVAAACSEHGVALLGGETAEMPGFYGDGEYDVAGFIVGVVERRRILDGSLAEVNIAASFQLDPLSAVMILVVTGVGFLIHLYSWGYMAHEHSLARYYAYLNLFMFAMLVLVLGDSLPLMFVGWEGVGLCSYLLIGFWYEDNDKASAGNIFSRNVIA